MMKIMCLCLAITGPATAQTVVATRTIPARSVITTGDIAVLPQATLGALTDPAAVVGMEARVAIYPNRPLTAADIGAPAVVARNQIIPLRYRSSTITITTEGRALDRGATGDLVRVMNLASRETVTARIGPDGIADVSQ